MLQNLKYIILRTVQRNFSFEFDDYYHQILEYTDELTDLFKYGEEENDMNGWIEFMRHCMIQDNFYDIQTTHDQNTTIIIMTYTMYQIILNTSLYRNDINIGLFLNQTYIQHV